MEVHTLRNSRNAEVDFVIFNERQTIQGACSMWKGEMTKLLMEGPVLSYIDELLSDADGISSVYAGMSGMK